MDITLKEIKEAYLYYKNEKYPKLRHEQKKEDGYYRQDYEPFPDDKEKYFKHCVKVPRGRRIVDGPADWLAMDKVVIHIPPQTNKRGEETLGEQKKVNKNEAWAQDLLDYRAQVQPYYLRMLSLQMPLRGENWLKIVPDWQYVKDYHDGKEYDGIPINWYVPDSLNMLSSLDLDDYSRPEMVFEEKVHEASYVRKLIAKWNPGKTGKKYELPLDVKGYQDVILVEWWTPKFRGIIVGDGSKNAENWQAIRLDDDIIAPNLNEVVPYIRGFSSLGMWPDDGDLRKLIVGFLRPMGEGIIQESRDRTKIDMITNYWVAAPMSWETDGTVILDPVRDLTVSYAKFFLEIKGRKNIKFFPPPPIPPAILDQISMNERQFEQWDPSILRGMGQSGETAVGQSQRIGLGLQHWEPLKITLKQVLANTMSTVFKIVEEMDVPVKINDKTISKKDVNGYYKNTINIKPGNPDEQVRKLLLAAGPVGDLYSDEDKAEKLMGEENPGEFVRKTRVSKILKRQWEDPNSPLARKAMADAYRELGEEELLAELDKAVEQNNKGIQPPVSSQGPVEGASPALGEPGISTQPKVATPQSQVNLQRAEEGMASLG